MNMIARHVEVNRTTGASLGCDKTFLSASYNFFMTSVMTSMYILQATGSASAKPEKVDPRVNIELHEKREVAKKKKGYLHPIVNPATLGFSTFPV